MPTFNGRRSSCIDDQDALKWSRYKSGLYKAKIDAPEKISNLLAKAIVKEFSSTPSDYPITTFKPRCAGKVGS
jgi:hypothetical protein